MLGEESIAFKVSSSIFPRHHRQHPHLMVVARAHTHHGYFACSRPFAFEIRG